MSRKEWTADEKKFLATNGPTTNIEDLAFKLLRSKASVDAYLRRHNLSRHYTNTMWSQREVFELYRLVERYGPNVIAKKLQRSKEEIVYKLHHLKLRTRTEVYSQARAWEVTGYHPYQLARAKRALGQIWMREIFRRRKGARPKVRYTITQKQLDAICEYMKVDPLKHQRKEAPRGNLSVPAVDSVRQLHVRGALRGHDSSPLRRSDILQKIEGGVAVLPDKRNIGVRDAPSFSNTGVLRAARVSDVGAAAEERAQREEPRASSRRREPLRRGA